MPRSRKIKHYSFGYMNRRRRRNQFFKVLLFLIILAALIFFGYCVAKSIGNLQNMPERSSVEESITSSEDSVVAEESLAESEDSSATSESDSASQSAIQAVFLPESALGDSQALDTFLSGLDFSSCNTVVIQLKSSTGALAYASEVPLAATCGAISSSAVSLQQLEETVSAIADAGFTPAAYLYTLEDDLASHASYNTSYLYNDQAGVTWLDQAADKGGRSWLNPYMDAAVTYLQDLTSEISKAGFSLIFADGIQYPSTKYPAEMGYGPNKASMTLTEALQNVLDTMQQEAVKNGSEVIPVFVGECYVGENENYYNGSPDTLQTDMAAPVLTSDRETEILDAIQLDKEKLIPVISSEDQISILESAGITQYLLKE